MAITQATLADWWGMHSGGWWIVGAAFMVLCMGGMMWMMMRGMGSKGSSTRSETPSSTESAVEVLERRFAEGEISAEEYRERRQILANGTATPNRGHKDHALTAPGPREGRE